MSDSRNALAARPRGVRNALVSWDPEYATGGPPPSADVAALAKEARNFVLDNLTTQNSPAEWLAQRVFPDYRSTNTAGIWADNPDMESLALAMAGPLKVGPDGKLSYGEFAHERAPRRADAGIAIVSGRKADAQAGGLRGVAFRNEGTGEVVAGRYTHPGSYDLLPANASTYSPGNKNPINTQWREGFIGPDGQFLTRQEAAEFVGKKPGAFGIRPALDAGDPASGLGLRKWFESVTREGK